MKKTVFSFLTMILITGMIQKSHCQNLLGTGARAGINITKFGGDDGPDFDGKADINLALFSIVKMSDFISIQPEIQYSKKGAVVEGGGEALTFSLTYIEIPILVKFALINDDDEMLANVFLGPAFGINTSSRALREVDGRLVDNVEREDFKESDFGLALGGDFSFPVGEGRLIFDARYTPGFSGINEMFDFKNQVIGVGVGFVFSPNR